MDIYSPYDYDILHWYSSLSGGVIAFYWCLLAISIAAMWILFQKAHEEGWASLIPFYNTYVLFKITWGNGWLFLLLLIPFANFVIYIITMVKLARVFGKGGGFACGLIFLNTIFLCIMAFDNSIQYVGVNGEYANNGGYGYGNGGAYGPNGTYRDPYTQTGYQSQTGYQNPYNGGASQNGYSQNPYNGGASQSGYTQSPENSAYYYKDTGASAQSQPDPSSDPPAWGSAQNAGGVKFCPNCGTKLEADIKFCPNCGAKQ
ncbi:MAG: DUF5684 domain-containing protein [Oscillospiraceae bacterium]|jgi:hypothetical protein